MRECMGDYGCKGRYCEGCAEAWSCYKQRYGKTKKGRVEVEQHRINQAYKTFNREKQQGKIMRPEEEQSTREPQQQEPIEPPRPKMSEIMDAGINASGLSKRRKKK